MSAPPGHVHGSERETPGPWICCVPTSGVMFAHDVIDATIPVTLAEIHELRKACGATHPTAAQIAAGANPGVSNAQLRAGLKARYSFTVPSYGTSFAALWSALAPGSVACITGKMGVFPAGHRLRRFDPAFTGYHKVWLYRDSSADAAWWDNPLAPKGTYQGEPITKAEVALYVNAAIAAGGAWIAAPRLSLGGADMAKYVSSQGYGVDSRKRLHVSAGTPVLGLDGSDLDVLQADADVPVFGLADSHTGQYVVRIDTRKPYADGQQRTTLALIRSIAKPVDAPPVPPTTGHSDEELAAAKKAVAADVALAATDRAATY